MRQGEAQDVVAGCCRRMLPASILQKLTLLYWYHLTSRISIRVCTYHDEPCGIRVSKKHPGIYEYLISHTPTRISTPPSPS